MGNASERRIERVKSLLLQVVSDVIREELSDPRIGIHSLTGVSISRDLSLAQIAVATVGGPEASVHTCAALNKAAPLIWNRLRHETDLRSVPRLRFVPDVSGEDADRVFQLIEELQTEGKLGGADNETTQSGDEPAEARALELNEPAGRPA
jgi:ribosome-binding factor A